MQSHRVPRLRAVTLAVAGSVLLAAPAMAARFTATEIGYDNALLSNFNVVTLGNLTTAATGTTLFTDGRVLVGGNLSVATNTGYGACTTSLSATGNRCPGNATAAVDSTGLKYGALTVFGNVTAASGAYWGAAYNSGGTAYVGGSAAGTFYANGVTNLNVAGAVTGLTVDTGKVTTTSTGNVLATSQKSGSQTNASYPTASAATVFPFSKTALTTEINNLAKGIAALPGSPGVTAQALPSQVSGNGLFTANADWTSNGKTYGVITTTMANLAGQTNFAGITNGSNAATFVIVTGDGANYTLPNLNSYADASKVIFEFVDATTLKFANAWNGTILAPLATITNMGGTINGTVVVNSILQSQAISSVNLFAGDLTGFVPEPASLTLFGLGAAGAAWVRRRRQKQQQEAA